MKSEKKSFDEEEDEEKNPITSFIDKISVILLKKNCLVRQAIERLYSDSR